MSIKHSENINSRLKFDEDEDEEFNINQILKRKIDFGLRGILDQIQEVKNQKQKLEFRKKHDSRYCLILKELDDFTNRCTNTCPNIDNNTQMNKNKENNTNNINHINITDNDQQILSTNEILNGTIKLPEGEKLKLIINYNHNNRSNSISISNKSDHESINKIPHNNKKGLHKKQFSDIGPSQAIQNLKLNIRIEAKDNIYLIK